MEPRPTAADAPRRTFASVEEVSGALRAASYIPDRGIATAVHLALAMERPLLLEGPAGVGKTEVAKALGRMLGCEPIRLQCYEGLDASHALYEWDYARQLLYARLHADAEAGAPSAADEDARVRRIGRSLYTPEFLLERPLLAAVRGGSRALLLIDELDRADDEFEAFLLELLSDFTVTIPELGTVAAASPPVVVITSNRTRELHDALKRRCLFHWIDFPTPEREAEIIELRVPGIERTLARQVADGVRRLRELGLVKAPGASEAVDWARALVLMGAGELAEEVALDTLGWVVKEHDDLALVREEIAAVVGG